MRLLIARKRANPAPTSAETVVVFLIETLQGCSNFQRFYQLSRSTVSAVQPVPVPVPSGKLETRKLEAHALASKLMKRELEAHASVGKQKKKLETHVPANKPKTRNPVAFVPAGKQKKNHRAYEPAHIKRMGII